jgi:hypothetical protein
LRNGINPIHRELFGDFDLRYYWSVHQREWATDVMFRDPEKLAGLYPQFLRHGLTTFASPKVLRRKQGDPHGDLAWRPLRKGVADLHRRAQVSEAANQRYLEALSCVQDTASLGSLTDKLCRPATWKGKRVRALNPYGPGPGKAPLCFGPGAYSH